MKKSTILIALGGNAILRPGQKATYEQQMANITECCKWLAPLVNKTNMLLTHGNGPQIGNLLLQQEIASEVIPTMPFDVCSGITQGLIGYMFQQALSNELERCNINSTVVSMLSRVEVSPADPAFNNYTKPVGGFYSKAEADVIAIEKGWTMMEDSGRGFRRVVASPLPISIIEFKAIHDMLDKDYTVIACGGGGIPIVKNQDGTYSGIDAVIDKDLTAALLGKMVKSDKLIFITEVDNVYLNFGQPNAKKLERISVSEMEAYVKEGHFGKGSMEPKIIAAIDYVKETGGQAIICSLQTVEEALNGEKGTIISLTGN